MTEDGYPDSLTHLRQELARIQLLLRACAEDESGAESDYRREARNMAILIGKRVAASTVELRLPALVDAFGLDTHQRDALLLCLLSEVDADSRRLVGDLSDGPVTVGLALRTVAADLAGMAETWLVFAAEGPLLAHGLVVVEPTGELRLADRIMRHLLGSDLVDSRLTGIVRQAAPARCPAAALMPDHDRAAALCSLAVEREPAMLLLHGRPGAGRRTLAAATCVEAGATLLFVDARAALTGQWPDTVRLCYREARLRDAIVCWTGVEQVTSREHDHWAVLAHAAAAYPRLTLLIGDTEWDPLEHPCRFLRIELGIPGFPDRRRWWRAMLPPPSAFAAPAPDPDDLAATLAATFRFTPGQISASIETATGLARLRSPGPARLHTTDLREGCRRQFGRGLVAFARRMPSSAGMTLDDLVLPVRSRRQLTDLATRIAARGRVVDELGFGVRLGLGTGVLAMFTGVPGTGKTTAARLLAEGLGVDLYRVDLAAIVSKYVGETEKNLEQVFEDAERTNAMLFFDEADALFAKRGEVRESRDRWANMEMAFLLQRVEEFSGAVILATNLRQNVEPALLRRLHAVVDFPLPDAESRHRIWSGMFPASVTPPDPAELAELAKRFPISGGDIRNVVLDAAFRVLGADRDATAIGLRELVVSVGREYRKLGLAITPADFGEKFYDWVTQDLLAVAGKETETTAQD
ncbi:ATP-binding protein [Saccharopolyspora phatthalungensis]|uniref:AAA+ superfamily predicted ATPase n=1 Tax=Saccharopolyspora phatthalungensis TaxID=664693 RepID=A0A840QB87_9PSEU|nr:ATP-binding protein [Saccharopolyspora phatthalungensis]MBB5157051.1 AAA+ superfamily predicted ATPase [Saccharopolyspora phatthalungensis]